MQFDNALCYGQSQPRMTGAALFTASLIKAVKDVRQILFGDTVSIIAHPYLHTGVAPRQCHLNLTTRPRIAQ